MTWFSRAAAVVAAGVLALPSSAYANGWSSADPEGDVTGSHWNPQPEPCGTTTDLDGSAEANEDIVRLGARHAPYRLRMVARFRDLDEAQEQHVWFYIRTPRRGWMLELMRSDAPSGKVRVDTLLIHAPRDPAPGDLDECGGYGFMTAGVDCPIEQQIDFAADTVVVTLPRTCLHSPRWVRVGLDAYTWLDSGDPATDGSSMFSDHWGVSPAGDTSIAPPLGPRLHAPSGLQPLPASNRSQVTSSSTGSRRSLVTWWAGLPIGTTAASAN